ncbi:hypothetical protein PTKIN_Ptkin12aG0190000 [Pterospermum kingtungense]
MAPSSSSSSSSSSSTSSCSNPNPKQRKQYSPLEQSPRMLKDFLLDDSNSCSSNGFKSFPRKASDFTIQNLIQLDLNSAHAKPKLQRSRSKAASTAISAFQAMLNAVKNIHFASAKSPSILPRSLSRKQSKKINSQLNVENKESEIKITVRVKDIIRWKSFRDLVEEKSGPSDFAPSPHHCTTTTTTTGSTCTPCSSNGSSWCDSDFTSECLPCEGYGDRVGKNFIPYVGKDPMETVAAKTAVGPTGKNKYASEEQEQHSPVSVLEFEYEADDDEDSCSSFNQSLAVVERTKENLMEKVRYFESLAKLEPVNLEKWMSLEETREEEEERNEVEEKARQMLNRVKETSSLSSYKSSSCIDKLVLDLFREEIVTKWNIQARNEEFECDMVRVAKAWIDGENNKETVKWGVREGCVRDMEREGRWRCKYEEEQEELAWEVERGVINVLVDELLVDLL